MILEFLSIFRKSQSSSPFEALNFICLSMCQRDVSPPVQIRWGPRAFSRVSTSDSDIPSSCEMKDEPAFKPLQENPAFFRVRALWYPFHSHIHIAEGSLLLKCLWQLGITLHLKPCNQLSCRDDLGCPELSSSCCA